MLDGSYQGDERLSDIFQVVLSIPQWFCVRRCFKSACWGCSRMAAVRIVFGLLVGMLAGCPGETVSDTPETLVAEGWRQYELTEYDDAVELFSTAADKAEPGSDIQLKALWSLGVTWDYRRPGNDSAIARQCFEKILAINPESSWAGWAALSLVRMRHVQATMENLPFEDLLPLYDSVIETYPDHPAAQEAMMFKAETQFVIEGDANVQGAIETLEKLLATYPDTPWKGYVYRFLAGGYERTKQYDKMVQTTEKQVLYFQDSKGFLFDKPREYYRLAACAEFLAGDFDMARRYYRKLIEDYPFNFRVFPAKQALERMDQLEAQVRRELSGDSRDAEGDAAL